MGETFVVVTEENLKKDWIQEEFGWGNPSDGKGSINNLTTDKPRDPISGGTPNRLFRCRIKVQ